MLEGVLYRPCHLIVSFITLVTRHIQFKANSLSCARRVMKLKVNVLKTLAKASLDVSWWVLVPELSCSIT